MSPQSPLENIWRGFFCPTLSGNTAFSAEQTHLGRSHAVDLQTPQFVDQSEQPPFKAGFVTTHSLYVVLMSDYDLAGFRRSGSACAQ